MWAILNGDHWVNPGQCTISRSGQPVGSSLPAYHSTHLQSHIAWAWADRKCMLYIKIPSYQCKKSHCRYKTVARPSYLNTGNLHTWKCDSYVGTAPVCFAYWHIIACLLDTIKSARVYTTNDSSDNPAQTDNIVTFQLSLQWRHMSIVVFQITRRNV